MSTLLYEKCTICGNLVIFKKQVALNHSLYLCTNNNCKHSVIALAI